MMLRLVLLRMVAVVPVLFGVSVLTFLLVRLVPGDVVDALATEEFDDPRAEAELRRLFGLDQPLFVQFGTWIWGVLHGDLGYSYRSRRPVLDEILDRFPLTLELTLAALLVSVVIAIPLGVLSATRRNGPVDTGARLLSLLGLSIPNFWLGILLMALFAVHLRWLPSGGSNAFAFAWDHFKFLILPAVTLGASLAAETMRMSRAALLEVLAKDYVRTGRAKGLHERVVIYRHALRNALIPVVTVVGIQAGALLGGTVVVEQIFSWAGLGSLVVRAIVQRDYPLLQGLILFLTSFYVIVGLMVDIAYMYLDPRLRRRG
jgi:peptide/nickel transport system permease protein